jgi:hypothetical protein
VRNSCGLKTLKVKGRKKSITIDESVNRKGQREQKDKGKERKRKDRKVKETRGK